MKTIHIIPMSGLCNRMRAMASGIFVAKQLRRPAIVYWNKTAGCRARFDELFEPCRVVNVRVLEGGVSNPTFTPENFFNEFSGHFREVAK